MTDINLSPASIRALAQAIGRTGGVPRTGGTGRSEDMSEDLNAFQKALVSNTEAEKKYNKRLKKLTAQQDQSFKDGKTSIRQRVAQDKRRATLEKEYERQTKKALESNLKKAALERKLASIQKNRMAALQREMTNEKAAIRRERLLRAKHGLSEMAGRGKERARDIAASKVEDVAGQGFGPSNFGGGATAGAARMLTQLGPIGIAIGAILGTALAGANRELENAAQARRRFLNYGSDGEELRGGHSGRRRQATREEAAGDYRQEISDINALRESAAALATEFNADADTLTQALVKAATRTGDSFRDMSNRADKSLGHTLARLEFQGVGTVDELTERYIKGRRQYGQSQSEAIDEMLSLSRDAREVGALTDDKFIVQMDEFYTAVEDVRGSIDSLTGSQKGLSRFMKAGVAVGKKLGLTYDQTLASVKKLTLGFSQNYDKGFAAVEVEKDLAEVLSDTGKKQIIKDFGDEKGKDIIKQVEELQARTDMLPTRKAAELQELLGTSTALLNARVTRSAREGGPLELAESRMGTTFDVGTRRIYEELVKELRKEGGGSSALLLDKLTKAQSDKVDAEEKAYEAREAAAKAAEFDVAKKANEVVQSLMTTAQTMFRSVVDGFKDILAMLEKTLRQLERFLPGGSSSSATNKKVKPGNLAIAGNFPPPPPLTYTSDESVNPGPVTPQALGGPVAASLPYLVGEKGPELFVPRQDGNIVPNNKLAVTPSSVSSQAGASGGIKVFVEFNIDRSTLANAFSVASMRQASAAVV